MIDGPLLARWARACVRQRLGGEAAARPDAPWCAEPGATFVTLRWRAGELQGCIGTIRPRVAIVEDVAQNAVAAATRDSRGARLALADLDDLDVDVSILSALEPVAHGTEAEMWSAIHVGDGVVLEHEDSRGVLLPVVWEKLPDVEQFATVLKRKAGLDRTFWSTGIRLWRYSVDHHIDRAPARLAKMG
jgi:AmmeMemoRadiSam system protein A